MKSNQIISMLVLLLIIGGIAFWGGSKYKQRNDFPQFNQRVASSKTLGRGMDCGETSSDNFINKNRGQVAGFRQTVGEVISMDDSSITVKLADGSSKIILISDTTTIAQSVAATKADLKVGVNVAVNGDQNTDGSVTSRNIEINPHIATVTPIINQ